MKSSKITTITATEEDPEDEKVPFYGQKWWNFVVIYVGIACSLWITGDYLQVVPQFMDVSEFVHESYRPLYEHSLLPEVSEGEVYGVCAPIEDLQNMNRKMFVSLQKLAHKPYFNTYKINLERQCPFWAQQRLCSQKGKCDVCECSDEEVPTFWKKESQTSRASSFGFSQQEVTQIPQQPQNAMQWCVQDYDETSMWTGKDDKDCMFVNLSENREQYTGFIGAPVWKALYEQNCFIDTTKKSFFNTPKAAPSFESLMDKAKESCTQETLLYQMISGLHTSVNSHISMQYNTNVTKEEELSRPKNSLYLTANASYFTERIGAHPDRIKNLYFVYAATLRALTILEPAYLKQSYATGVDGAEDEKTKKEIRELLAIFNEEECNASFKEQKVQQEWEGHGGEAYLNQLQNKFFNVSKIMDCISCDRCRLNGKVQVRGLSNVLKALFLPQSKQKQFQAQLNQQDLISVMQLLAKLSESIEIIKYYTYWAIRGRALVKLESRKCLAGLAGIAGIPVALLVWFVAREVFGLKERVLLKANVRKNMLGKNE